MPVEMESFFSKAVNYFRKKALAHMFERVLNTLLELYLFHALLLQKRYDKPYQFAQIFFSENTLDETYP